MGGTNSKSGQTNLPTLNKSDIDGRCDLLVRYDSLDQSFVAQIESSYFHRRHKYSKEPHKSRNFKL